MSSRPGGEDGKHDAASRVVGVAAAAVGLLGFLNAFGELGPLILALMWNGYFTPGSSPDSAVPLMILALLLTICGTGITLVVQGFRSASEGLTMSRRYLPSALAIAVVFSAATVAMWVVYQRWIDVVQGTCGFVVVVLLVVAYRLKQAAEPKPVTARATRSAD